MGLGERRGLSEARPARRIELIRELLVPALQTITLVLGTRQRIAQPRHLFLQSLDLRIAIVRPLRQMHIGHTLVMPEG